MDDDLQKEMAASILRLRHLLDQNAGRTEVLMEFLMDQEAVIGSLGASLHEANDPVTLDPSHQRFIGLCLTTLCSLLMEHKVHHAISRNAKFIG